MKKQRRHAGSINIKKIKRASWIQICFGVKWLNVPRRLELLVNMAPSQLLPQENSEKIEISRHTKSTCPFSGKTKMKRRAVGIWHCGSCRKSRWRRLALRHRFCRHSQQSAIGRPKELKDQQKLHNLKHGQPIINGLICVTKKENGMKKLCQHI